MRRVITLRPARAEDEPFLYALYKRSRAEEFAIAGFGDAQLDAFMQLQYAARKASYEGNYPGAQHDIVVVEGEDAGQIWVYRDQAQHRLIDISIARPFQNQGIGGALLRRLIAEANDARVPLCCSVATNNPGSLRFHRRFGFRITGANEAYYQLELAQTDENR